MLWRLKSENFRLETAEDAIVTDANVVNVMTAEGRQFKLFFDKITNLPMKLAADDIETIYSDFKDFNGIQKATKIEMLQPLGWETEIVDFKLLSDVDVEAFAEPNNR